MASSISIMRPAGMIIGAVTVVLFGGCSSGEMPTPTAQTERSSSSAAASAVKDVPALAPGDSKTHTFRVTIRDFGGVNQYTDKTDGTCVSNAPKGFPHQLVVTGALHY